MLIDFIAEIAGLLPVKYFKKRYKLDWDVRENLFNHQKKLSQWKSNTIEDRNTIEDGYQADQPYKPVTQKLQKEPVSDQYVLRHTNTQIKNSF